MPLGSQSSNASEIVSSNDSTYQQQDASQNIVILSTQQTSKLPTTNESQITVDQATKTNIENFSEDELLRKSNAILKNLCRTYKLRTSGNKNELVSTLLKFYGNPKEKTKKRSSLTTSTSASKKKKSNSTDTTESENVKNRASKKKEATNKKRKTPTSKENPKKN